MIKQQLDNSKCVADTWIFFSKSNTGGRPKIVIDKYMLKCLMTAGTNNTGISKIFKVHCSMVARWIKENEMENIFREPEDDDDAIKN